MLCDIAGLPMWSKVGPRPRGLAAGRSWKCLDTRLALGPRGRACPAHRCGSHTLCKQLRVLAAGCPCQVAAHPLQTCTPVPAVLDACR